MSKSKSAALKHWFKVGRNTLASTLRGWQGLAVTPAKIQPEKPLKLYEFEACPYCRLVREVMTELGLDVDVYPCPKGGVRFRPEVKRLGGKAQFPYLIDDNTGVSLYESGQIIEYLYETYGQRALPLRHRLRSVQMLSSYVNTAVAGLGGMNAQPSKMPELPLILYSFEASPFSRPVRERLCELEIPYRLVNLGKEQFADMGAFGVHAALGSYTPVEGGKREKFLNAHHKMMLPYLEDPNTGKGLFESQDILEYLDTHYAV